MIALDPTVALLIVTVLIVAGSIGWAMWAEERDNEPLALAAVIVGMVASALAVGALVAIVIAGIKAMQP